jgi:hypothetical protein
MTPLEVYADMERIVADYNRLRTVYRTRTKDLLADHRVDRYVAMEDDIIVTITGIPAIFHFDTAEWDVEIESGGLDVDPAPVFKFMKEMDALIDESTHLMYLAVEALGWTGLEYPDGGVYHRDGWRIFVPYFCTDIEEIEVEETD